MSAHQRESSWCRVGETDAPDLHCFVRQLKVGDIVYLKSFSPSSPNLGIKGIGIISDSVIRNADDTGNTVKIGRNVKWIVNEDFEVPKPKGKGNVRANTAYEEFHPKLQEEIIRRIVSKT